MRVVSCISATSRVLTIDGLPKRVSELKKGELVLGSENLISLSSSEVLSIKKVNNVDWISLKADRRCAGRGAVNLHLICSSSSKIPTSSSKFGVEARNLGVSDEFYISTYDTGLNNLEESVILGKVLGDGSVVRVSKKSWALEFGQKEEHAQYVEYTNKYLHRLVCSPSSERISGFGTKMVVSRTIRSPHICSFLSGFYTSGKKDVPPNVDHLLTPLALAFWYMDDGSLAHNEGQEDRAYLHTSGFSDQGCRNLIAGLRKFGVSADLKTYEGFNLLHLKSAEADRLFCLIAPYIPTCMQYKLPERYRGLAVWEPRTSLQFRPDIVNLSNGVVTKNTKAGKVGYLIRTETGNYFANGVLVVN